MKNKVIYPLIFVVFGAACGGDDEARRKGANGEYEVVQEGSASGVTSSIQGPGESLPPITGTNADTTTAFTIDPNAVASTTPGAPAGGTLATTLPSQPMYPPAQPFPAPQPMTSSTSRPSYEPPRQQPQPVRTQPAPQPQPQPVDEQPPATDTTVTQAPPTQTSPPAQTAPPTNQPPQELPKPPAKEEEEEPEEEEPPPPTTTDTRGQ